MIVQCCEKDRNIVMDYLNVDRVLNLFFVGDIENFGFENDFQKIFMDLENDKIKTVYLLFHDSFLITSQTGDFNQEFIDECIEKYHILNFSGEEKLVEKINLEGFKNDDCYFCKMTKSNQLPIDLKINIATLDTVEKVESIHNQIFGLSKSGLKESISTNTGRTYYFEKDDKIVSVASSTAETEGLAMVVGVCTLDDHRNCGYASQLVSKLCNDLLNEKKVPCLFYNNPDAGKIYHRLGFEDIGRWALRRNERK